MRKQERWVLVERKGDEREKERERERGKEGGEKSIPRIFSRLRNSRPSIKASSSRGEKQLGKEWNGGGKNRENK